MVKNSTNNKNEVQSLVKHFNSLFSQAVNKVAFVIGNQASRIKNKKDKSDATPLYTIQVEYSYLIDDLERGPKYLVPQKINEIGSFIREVESAQK